jgi:hypothetical protein
MLKWQIRLVALAVVAGIWLTPSKAEAKGFVLITHGETAKHLADVPADAKEGIRKATGQDGTKIGYCHSYFGVFWIDLWTWKGYHCLYKDHTVWKLEPAEAAELLKVEEKKLGKPFTYSFPPGLIIVVLLTLVFVASKVFGKKDDGAPPPAQDSDQTE